LTNNAVIVMVLTKLMVQQTLICNSFGMRDKTDM